MTLQVHDPASASPEADGPLHSPAERLDYARQVLRSEAAALETVADRIGDSFLQAVDLILNCPGRVAITGTGKSADVGQKIAGTLNSTGTRAYILDATKAMHGDLGMVHASDVVLMLSHSGESEEIVRLLGPIRDLALGVVAITGNASSTLARKADVALAYGPLAEVCPLGLAPSTSTTAMIALGDALAFVLLRLRAFTQDDFARFHPAGSLGRKLMRVEAVMRQGPDLRLAAAADTVRTVLSQAQRGRRTGAVMLLDEAGKLAGIFTDSDLARLIGRHLDAKLDRPISEVMTEQPHTVTPGARVADAVELLRRYKISELPVVDADGKAVGLIDITDVIGLIPAEAAKADVLPQVA